MLNVWGRVASNLNAENPSTVFDNAANSGYISDGEAVNTNSPGQSDEFSTLSAEANIERWYQLVTKLQQKSKTSIFLILPNSVSSVFDIIQLKTSIKFTADDRKLCYHEFCKKASSLGTVHSSEIEEMLSSNPQLGFNLTLLEIRSLIHEKSGLEHEQWAGQNVESVNRDSDLLSFAMFVSIVADARHLSQARLRGWSAPQRLRSALPIDPDSTTKQRWDFFMLLLLLYCSFSVPYEIAFLDNGLPAIDLFELLVHAAHAAVNISFEKRARNYTQGCVPRHPNTEPASIRFGGAGKDSCASSLRAF